MGNFLHFKSHRQYVILLYFAIVAIYTPYGQACTVHRSEDFDPTYDYSADLIVYQLGDGSPSSDDEFQTNSIYGQELPS